MRNGHVLIIAAPDTLKFVKDAIILVEITKLAPQMVVNWDGLDGPRFHINVPDLQ